MSAVCYFPPAVPQAGCLHSELHIRIKVADIKMMNWPHRAKLPFVSDHFYVLISPAHTQCPIHADVPLRAVDTQV